MSVAPVLSDASSATSATTGRECAWCHGEIPTTSRRDAITCSQRCRQARHRFTRAVLPFDDERANARQGGATALLSGNGLVRRPLSPATEQPRPRTLGVAPRSRSLRLAYADPPYPGKARIYRDHPDYGGEVDHVALIRRLCSYDGWALSTSAAALPAVLASCPAGVRVAAWFRGERPTRSARPLNAWEPVIYAGGRACETSNLEQRRLDALVFTSRPRLTDPLRVVGAKPATFARWLFDLLGALPGDELDDLFPGSGGIARAWSLYSSSGPVRPVEPHRGPPRRVALVSSR